MRAVIVVFALLCPVVASADPKTIDIEPFANANIQATLYPTFPTGRIVPEKNKFGVPFNIPPDVNNYVVISSDKNPLTIRIGVPGVVKVYTLMQAFAPYSARRICTVEFTGSGGAHQVVPMWSGQNIRDFFESAYARTINNTTTQAAYEFIGRGGAYTGDATNGPRGFYLFDEQEFRLNADFAHQTLDTITIKVSEDHVGTPILLGLTVVTAKP